jgi:hypothetical protein
MSGKQGSRAVAQAAGRFFGATAPERRQPAAVQRLWGAAAAAAAHARWNTPLHKHLATRAAAPASAVTSPPPSLYSTRPALRCAHNQRSVAADTGTAGSCGSAARTRAMCGREEGMSA